MNKQNVKGKISWSELRQYQSCAYQFHLKNTNEVSLINVNKQAKTKGLNFHGFCENYHDSWKNGEPSRTKKFKRASFQWFHEFECDRYDYCLKEGIPWKPLYQERTFESNDWLCIVDRIDYLGDGTFMMIEYKNKPGSFDKQQLAFEYNLITDNYSFCNLCIEIVSNNNICHKKVMKPVVFAKFGIIYAEHPDENYYKKPNKTSLNSMRKKMSATLLGIRGGHFPAKPGFPCFYCDFGKLGHCDTVGVNFHQCSKCSIPLKTIDKT